MARICLKGVCASPVDALRRRRCPVTSEGWRILARTKAPSSEITVHVVFAVWESIENAEIDRQ